MTKYIKLDTNKNLKVEYHPDNGKFWFSVVTDDGGTQKQPYGFIDRETLAKIQYELLDLEIQTRE